jgi:hypothetical protein
MRGLTHRPTNRARAAITWVVATAAVIGTMISASPARAQWAPTAGPVSLGDLFVPDGVDLSDDAPGKLREATTRASAPGGCPQQARFKVTVKQGDPLFQSALAAARRDTLKAFLDRQIPSSPFEVTSGIGSHDDVQLDYGRAPDREPPKLQTSSTPTAGTKVKPGGQIKVTLVARDDANAWQTGIRSIQVIAQAPGGDERVGEQGYPPVIRSECEGRPEPRTLEVTYTVPSNPPPIVRLVAITEDFANLTDLDRAEFPTGDWYGWVTWSETLLNVPSRKPTRYWGRLDFTADYDGRGNMTGKMAGTEDFEGELEGHPCDLAMTRPTSLEVPLLGQYTPGQNAMSLSADPRGVKFTLGELGYSCPSAAQEFGRLDPVIRPELDDIMRNIPLTDGSHAEVRREWNPASNGIGRLHMSLTLRRAQR